MAAEDIDSQVTPGTGKRHPAGNGAIPIRPGIDPAKIVFARGDHVEIADAVLRKLGPEPITYDVGRVWRYASPTGIWSSLEEEGIEDVAAGFAGCQLLRGEDGVLCVNAATVKGARHVLRNRLLSEPGRIAFDHAPAGMAFANGFVTVADGVARVLPHGPMHLARWRYEFDYRPSAPHTLLDAFLAQIFADVPDPEERRRRIALLQEFLGACLVGDATRYQRYLVIFARGGNGKSEILRICRACFQPGTVTSIEPQKWSDDKHAAALEGVRANFVDELPDDEIMGGHNVKRVVTGEPITARRVYKDTITFIPRAGHIFATNVEMQSTDYSDGFWERPFVLVLSRKFRQSPKRVLEAAKNVIEMELPGIIAWAIEGACRAQTQKGYTEPGSSASTLLEWRDDNDQVRGYVGDMKGGKGLSGRWSALTLYEDYREWAKKNGCAVMSNAKFGRRIVANALARRGRDHDGRFYAPVDDTTANMTADEIAEVERAATIDEADRCG